MSILCNSIPAIVASAPSNDLKQKGSLNKSPSYFLNVLDIYLQYINLNERVKMTWTVIKGSLSDVAKRLNVQDLLKPRENIATETDIHNDVARTCICDPSLSFEKFSDAFKTEQVLATFSQGVMNGSLLQVIVDEKVVNAAVAGQPIKIPNDGTELSAIQLQDRPNFSFAHKVADKYSAFSMLVYKDHPEACAFASFKNTTAAFGEQAVILYIPSFIVPPRDEAEFLESLPDNLFYELLQHSVIEQGFTGLVNDNKIDMAKFNLLASNFRPGMITLPQTCTLMREYGKKIQDSSITDEELLALAEKIKVSASYDSKESLSAANYSAGYAAKHFSQALAEMLILNLGLPRRKEAKNKIKDLAIKLVQLVNENSQVFPLAQTMIIQECEKEPENYTLQYHRFQLALNDPALLNQLPLKQNGEKLLHLVTEMGGVPPDIKVSLDDRAHFTKVLSQAAKALEERDNLDATAKNLTELTILAQKSSGKASSGWQKLGNCLTAFGVGLCVLTLTAGIIALLANPIGSGVFAGVLAVVTSVPAVASGAAGSALFGALGLGLYEFGKEKGLARNISSFKFELTKSKSVESAEPPADPKP